MITTPQLFATVQPIGKERCFYCGGQCDESHTETKFVKPSFTERDKVLCGSSDYVCGGCVATLSDDTAITLIDGELRFHQRVRNYSWVITSGHRIAATKSHREQLLATCLMPPVPPFAICLADGQKHQLWRTPVNDSRSIVSVNIEGVIATFATSQLSDRLEIVKRLIGCCGKPDVSAGAPSRTLWPRLAGAMSPSEVQLVCILWDRVRMEPLTKLACWLAPGKDQCNDERDDSAPAD